MAINLMYIGDPLLDIAANCKTEKIEDFGLRVDDWIKADERHEKLFESLLHDPSSSFFAGGSSQNSARISKWILGDKGIVSFSGCVGKDEYARKMKKELEKFDVKPLYIEHDSLQTGLCACLTGCDGERSMCSNLFAAASYDESHFNSPVVQQALKEANAIYLACYFVAHSPAVARRVADFCCANQKIFALSLSSSFICESFTEEVLHHVRYANFVFGNYKEASSLMTKMTGKQDVSIEESVKWIAELPQQNVEPKRIVVITNGPFPVVTCTNQGEPLSHTVPPVKCIVDTIGCGDALASGFLATYLLTKSIEKAAQVGIKVASLLTQARGCTLPESTFARTIIT